MIKKINPYNGNFTRITYSLKEMACVSGTIFRKKQLNPTEKDK